MTIETHPLEPFLPENARILFLGSFPPPRSKWSMDFFYPNWINDFWRIMGLVHYGDKSHFEVVGEKRFDEESVKNFAKREGLAFFDTARKVCRLKDNASDNYLEILEPTDIEKLLSQLPECQRIVTTGGKASQELWFQLSKAVLLEGESAVFAPQKGMFCKLKVYGREIEWWRMPSTSRAYPMPITEKAEYYVKLFQ